MFRVCMKMLFYLFFLKRFKNIEWIRNKNQQTFKSVMIGFKFFVVVVGSLEDTVTGTSIISVSVKILPNLN